MASNTARSKTEHLATDVCWRGYRCSQLFCRCDLGPLFQIQGTLLYCLKQTASDMLHWNRYMLNKNNKISNVQTNQTKPKQESGLSSETRGQQLLGWWPSCLWTPGSDVLGHGTLYQHILSGSLPNGNKVYFYYYSILLRWLYISKRSTGHIRCIRVKQCSLHWEKDI